MSEWLNAMIQTWFQWVHDWGYTGVVILMAMESSIFPVPSEVVVPPAAILAAQTNGAMTFWGVVIAGTVGSYLGSAITYWVSLWVGRPIIMRYGRYFFMPPDKVERAERFMHRYESGGIFFARLLPVLRHLISIPAGIIRMNFWKFSILTTVGAFIWCYVLAVLGIRVGQKLTPEQLTALQTGQGLDVKHLIAAVKHEALWIMVAIILVCVLYFVGQRLTAKAHAADAKG
jgi:membrane protein DedA with SNARE-associated domain